MFYLVYLAQGVTPLIVFRRYLVKTVTRMLTILTFLRLTSVPSGKC